MTYAQAAEAVSTDGIASTGAQPSSRSVKRVALASFIGTVIEFYDFVIYGTAAALVFPHLFFPALGTAAGTVASLATFGVAFLARPFGSILFGHFGDRLGRKKTLIATLLLMGSATILVGLMPTADQIGVAAPILIVVLRVLQGLAAGGEFAGAVLFSSEHAPKGKRGFWSSFANLGSSAAVMLANATFLVIALFVADDTFINWGWRVPFLASFLLVAVGLWMRMRIDETPVFKSEVSRAGVSRFPLLEAWKSQPRQIVLATGTVIMIMALVYVGVTYLVSYGTQVLGLARVDVLVSAMLGGLTMCIGCVLGAILSDNVGRRVVLIGTACAGIVWSLALFPVLDLGSPVTFGIGLTMTTLIAGVGTGPLGAFLSELFNTRYRYTATAFSHSVAGILGGAVPPLAAPAIVAAFGGFAFGVVLAGACLVSLICVLAIGETRQLDLDRPTAGMQS